MVRLARIVIPGVAHHLAAGRNAAPLLGNKYSVAGIPFGAESRCASGEIGIVSPEFAKSLRVAGAMYNTRKSGMVRRIFLLTLLLFVSACRETSVLEDRDPCIQEWSDTAGELPHFDGFIIISVLDSTSVRINDSDLMSTDKLIDKLASESDQLRHFPIRVIAKDCAQSKELYVRMKKANICLEDNCRFAPDWKFPS
jgi:hypothetical protein